MGGDRRRALRAANGVLDRRGERRRGLPPPLTLVEWLGVLALIAWAIVGLFAGAARVP